MSVENFLQLEEAWKYLVILPAVGAGIVVSTEWIKYLWYGNEGRSNISVASPYGIFCVTASLPAIIPAIVVGGVYMTLAPYSSIRIGSASVETTATTTDDEEPS